MKPKAWSYALGEVVMNRSILLLTNAYPDVPSSHRGIFIQRVASLLQREGWKIFVVTPKIFRKSEYVAIEKGIRVFRFPFFAGDRLLIEYTRIPYLKMVFYYLTGILLSFYVTVKYGCQLIHAHWAIPTGPIGAIVSILLRRPLIVTIHGSDLRVASQSPFLKAVFIWVCKTARQLTCVSEVQRRQLEMMGIDSNSVSVFPMGVDDLFFDVGVERDKGKRNRPFTVLSNRNFQPIYNVSHLIKAIPRVLNVIPTARFIIAGEGPERKKLEEEVSRLGIAGSVTFLGQVAHEDMPSLLSIADVYVSTSLSDGTSVSLLEAMAAGAFPVVTDIPANREWITDGENGFLVPVGEESLLADRIVRVLSNEELKKHARQRNRDVVNKKASLRHHMARLGSIYEPYVR